MKQITPDNVKQVFAEITAFLGKGPVNVHNSGINYGPVRITPKLEPKTVKLSRGTTELPVLDLCETGGGAGAGAMAIWPSDSEEGKTYYELHETSLTLTQITPRGGTHKIWLLRP